MTIKLLLGLVFLSQIVIISSYLPRKLAKQIVSAASGVSGHEVVDQEPVGSVLSLYSTANKVMIALGVALLAVFFVVDMFESLRVMLLTIGVFFFVQVSPLMLVRSVLVSHSPRASAAPRLGYPPEAIGLFDVVSPVLVGLASAVFLAYVAAKLVTWNGAWDAQLFKVLILTGANVFFIVVLRRHLRAPKREQGEASLQRFQELKKIALTLVYISIGTSAYFFGKDVIFILDVAQIRPVMMSVFLQML